MCGIALIISGVRIYSSFTICDSISSSPNLYPFPVTINDLKDALTRRGPDSLGSTGVFFKLKGSASTDEQKLISYIGSDEAINTEASSLNGCHKMHDCTFYSNGENGYNVAQSSVEMQFLGAVLQLRGMNPIMQPLMDTFRNILVYNGEIFGGIQMSSDSNDAEVLMQSLGKCCGCDSHGDMSNCDGKTIPELLSSIKGPWAVVYWQDSSKKLWFGRDAFGRRSLIVHWPTLEDPRLLLSSVSAPYPTTQGFDPEVERGGSKCNYWEELPCGLYSIYMAASSDECITGEVEKHEWMDSMLKEIIMWERACVKPNHEKFANGSLQPLCSSPAHILLGALRESVARRATKSTIFKAILRHNGQKELVPIAVLFSGGLDSMILAAILHECLDSSYAIDLLNVSFEGQSAPDRITAKAGVKELKRVAPLRRWRLVEIDAELSCLNAEINHVMSLISPANTYMDLNIGIALWLAARGDGWAYEAASEEDVFSKPVKYKSEARILLVGSGADEQCAGYGRHRTKYRSGSWVGLHEEMKLDMQRIWKRNLGRDDRCIADNGKEARFPFLDEDVIRILLELPLWEIANLDQPIGIGDKKILREVARLLGLHEAAVQPKRAIQFGSRIARESNRMNFGSNRAANQASAGSVIISKLSSES